MHIQNAFTQAARHFDGSRQFDIIQAESHRILTTAIADEIEHRGKIEITGSLACFIEFRIAEVLRSCLVESFK